MNVKHYVIAAVIQEHFVLKLHIFHSYKDFNHLRVLKYLKNKCKRIIRIYKVYARMNCNYWIHKI